MTDDDLLALWRAEERPQPDGWDFSGLADRMMETPVPWDLDAVYRAALADAHHVLDMGTGGGEYLSTFTEYLPKDTVATEGWPPNVGVARRNLAPLGIDVVEYAAPDHDVDSVAMPFPDDRFDLVLNRHEAFSERELARVIVPGGQFITEQVGGDEAAELRRWFGAPPGPDFSHVNLADYRRVLKPQGFDIVEAGEHTGEYRFIDVAALVAYLQLVPWETPDEFSVDHDAEALLALHHESGGGPIIVTRKRFWVRAVRR